MNRPLFGHDGSLTKEQLYEMIDQAPKGTYFYRAKLNFDPKKEDWDKGLALKELTKETIRALERQLHEETGIETKIAFAATIHNDHTDLRHVHILALVPGRLQVRHLKTLTATATAEAKAQRRDRDRQRGLDRGYPVEPRRSLSPPLERGDGLVVGRPGRTGHSLSPPDCPRCDIPMTLTGSVCVCIGCGLRFSRDREQAYSGRRMGGAW